MDVVREGKDTCIFATQLLFRRKGKIKNTILYIYYIYVYILLYTHTHTHGQPPNSTVSSGTNKGCSMSVPNSFPKTSEFSEGNK